MVYDVVAKNASASYCVGAGRAGGGVAASAAIAAGLDSEPQPASSSEAPSAPKVSEVMRVFMRLPGYFPYPTQFLSAAAAWATMPDDGHGNHPAQRTDLGRRLPMRCRPGRSCVRRTPRGVLDLVRAARQF